MFLKRLLGDFFLFHVVYLNWFELHFMQLLDVLKVI